MSKHDSNAKFAATRAALSGLPDGLTPALLTLVASRKRDIPEKVVFGAVHWELEEREKSGRGSWFGHYIERGPA